MEVRQTGTNWKKVTIFKQGQVYIQYVHYTHIHIIYVLYVDSVVFIYNIICPVTMQFQ